VHNATAAVLATITMGLYVFLPVGQMSGQLWIPDPGASFQFITDRAWTGSVIPGFEIRVTGHVLIPPAVVLEIKQQRNALSVAQL